ncbi:MAG TPA: tetratricopeptide repeat protein [Micromonosporaceae bacterium]|nr:tetratricopeptide repeat protein [Micromonosporaceae bacterium]
MEFVILGPTALYVGRNPVPLGAAKQRAMLGLLLYHVGTPVRIDILVDQLWDGRRRPDDHRTDLYEMASRIRATLRHVGLGGSLVTLRSPRAYQLNIDPNLVDFHRVERLVAESREAARHEHHDTVVRVLTAVTGSWRGDPLADLRGARAEHIRRHINDAFLEAHRLLANSRLKLGEHHAVLAQVEPFIRTGDLDETLAQHWITALCAAGREGDARRFFVTFRRRYRAEVGTEPAVKLPPATNKPRRSQAGGQAAAVTTTIGQVIPGRCQPPPDVPDFIGQDELLTRLDSLTDKSDTGANVVLVCGMPGVGKTTLAVHWAHQRRHRFPDGQLYIKLNAFGAGPAMESGEALSRFLYALGLSADVMPANTDERRDRFNELVVGRRILVILDDVRDTDQARALIPTSASCATVITSRTRLGGLTIRDGVRNLTISPLPDHNGLELLQRVVGTSRVAAEPSAAQVLTRLSGGLPLALRVIGEQVAERSQASLADLVDELGARLLDSETDDEEANLHTIFGWSYDALAPDAAHLFLLLGLYPGASIGPEAAAAMCGGGAHHTERLLNRLARSHLVIHDVVRHYRLHDLLRRYAAARALDEVPPEDRAGALRRLVDWYLLSAANAAAMLAPDQPPVPDLPTPDGIRPQTFDTEPDAMRWGEVERANIGAVTRWAAAHGFQRHGWQIPGAIHEIYNRYGSKEDVLELHELALLAAQQDGHPEGQTGTLSNLGAFYFALRDYRRAINTWEEALRLAREIGYTNVVLACSHNLASAYLHTGNVAAAVPLYIGVLDACRNTSNAPGEASSLHRLGYAYRWLKQYDQAISCYIAALTIRQRIGSLRGQGTTYGELAALYLEMNEIGLALRHCQLALKIYERTKDEAARCDALITRADVQRKLAIHKDAARDAQRAIAISEEIADPQRHARALTVLADTLLAMGNTDATNRVCREALDLLGSSTDPEARSLRDRLTDITARLPL